VLDAAEANHEGRARGVGGSQIAASARVAFCAMDEADVAGRLESVEGRIDRLIAERDRYGESALAMLWSLILVLPATLASGFTLAWSIALAIAGDDVLPVWPAFVGVVLTLTFVPLAALRMRPELWKRNVTMTRDNLLLLIITSAIGLGLFTLGLAIG
jgi:hypothetical protein